MGPLGLITCGEVEGRHKCPHSRLPRSGAGFSMIFLLSSSCCSSLRWKKGKRKSGQEEGEEVEEGSQVEEKTNHMDDHGDGVKVRTRLELEPKYVSVMRMYKEQGLRARASVVQCYAKR